MDLLAGCVAFEGDADFNDWNSDARQLAMSDSSLVMAQVGAAAAWQTMDTWRGYPYPDDWLPDAVKRDGLSRAVFNFGFMRRPPQSAAEVSEWLDIAFPDDVADGDANTWYAWKRQAMTAWLAAPAHVLFETIAMFYGAAQACQEECSRSAPDPRDLPNEQRLKLSAEEEENMEAERRECIRACPHPPVELLAAALVAASRPYAESKSGAACLLGILFAPRYGEFGHMTGSVSGAYAAVARLWGYYDERDGNNTGWINDDDYQKHDCEARVAFWEEQVVSSPEVKARLTAFASRFQSEPYIQRMHQSSGKNADSAHDMDYYHAWGRYHMTLALAHKLGAPIAEAVYGDNLTSKNQFEWYKKKWGGLKSVTKKLFGPQSAQMMPVLQATKYLTDVRRQHAVELDALHQELVNKAADDDEYAKDLLTAIGAIAQRAAITGAGQPMPMSEASRKSAAEVVVSRKEWASDWGIVTPVPMSDMDTQKAAYATHQSMPWMTEKRRYWEKLCGALVSWLRGEHTVQSLSPALFNPPLAASAPLMCPDSKEAIAGEVYGLMERLGVRGIADHRGMLIEHIGRRMLAQSNRDEFLAYYDDNVSPEDETYRAVIALVSDASVSAEEKFIMWQQMPTNTRPMGKASRSVPADVYSAMIAVLGASTRELGDMLAPYADRYNPGHQQTPDARRALLTLARGAALAGILSAMSGRGVRPLARFMQAVYTELPSVKHVEAIQETIAQVWQEAIGRAPNDDIRQRLHDALTFYQQKILPPADGHYRTLTLAERRVLFSETDQMPDGRLPEETIAPFIGQPPRAWIPEDGHERESKSKHLLAAQKKLVLRLEAEMRAYNRTISTAALGGEGDAWHSRYYLPNAIAQSRNLWPSLLAIMALNRATQDVRWQNDQAHIISGSLSFSVTDYTKQLTDQRAKDEILLPIIMAHQAHVNGMVQTSAAGDVSPEIGLGSAKSDNDEMQLLAEYASLSDTEQRRKRPQFEETLARHVQRYLSAEVPDDAKAVMLYNIARHLDEPHYGQVMETITSLPGLSEAMREVLGAATAGGGTAAGRK